MSTLKKYVVRKEAMAFIPHYTESGKLITWVMESDSSFYADMAPSKLMNQCLGYYGTSLRGATDGARNVLGNINMCPVLMSEKLELYWFPTKSLKKHDCVWLALQHVEDYENAESKQTKVTFSNGGEVTIDISFYRFKERIQQAYQLKGKLEERLKPNNIMVKDKKFYYHLRKTTGFLNYEIEKEKE